MSSFLIVVLALCRAGFAQAPEWQIEDVILPPTTIAGHYSSWYEAHPMGDQSNSGRASFWLSGVEGYGNQSGQTHMQRQVGILRAGVGSFSLPVDTPYDSPIDLHGHRKPLVVLLQTPNGLNSVVLQEGTERLLCISTRTRQLVNSYAPPAPLPGTGEYLDWAALFNSGDLNQDGYDDLFAIADTTANDGYFACLDGATFTISWHQVIPRAGGVSYPTLPMPTEGFKDIDGDSIPDFITAAGTVGVAQPERVVVGFSGIDGSTIFETRLPTYGADTGITSLDISGDGIADVVTAAGLMMAAVSGQDGRVLWQTDMHDFQAFLPPGQWFASKMPVFFGSVPTSGMPEYVHSLISQYEPGETHETQYVATYRCADGVAIGAFPLRGSLEPFLPDDYQGQNIPSSWVLGDIDRDGLTEFGHLIQVLSLASVELPNGPHVMAIYGQPTIDFPTQLSLSQGQPHSADFHIPSAGNMSLQMYLSTTFDQNNGYSHDNWDTFLGQDRLFTWSAANAMTVNMNANGEGSIGFSLPNHSALLGRKIYARGVVAAPSDPLNKVWTMSSLGIGECVP